VRHERFESAWGGEEGAQRYYDEAVNLRTARDMARAGGVFGLYEQLYVPTTVRMNIYNDLVAAYAAGFFGLLGLLLVMSAYFVFYAGLFAGLKDSALAKLRPAKAEERAPAGAREPQGMPPPVAPRNAAARAQTARPGDADTWRHALWAYAAG
jgi:hypothetical protein